MRKINELNEKVDWLIETVSLLVELHMPTPRKDWSGYWGTPKKKVLMTPDEVESWAKGE